MSHDAYVANAADLEQTQSADRRVKRDDQARYRVLRGQMDTPAGRRFVWEELERHQLFHRVRSWSHEAVYEFLGRREAGLDLWWQLKQWMPEALVLMQQEAQAREARDTRDRQAVHTARASEERPDA